MRGSQARSESAQHSRTEESLQEQHYMEMSSIILQNRPFTPISQSVLALPVHTMDRRRTLKLKPSCLPRAAVKKSALFYPTFSVASPSVLENLQRLRLLWHLQTVGRYLGRLEVCHHVLFRLWNGLASHGVPQQQGRSLNHFHPFRVDLSSALLFHH
jgi:hypothetical protein